MKKSATRAPAARTKRRPKPQGQDTGSTNSVEMPEAMDRELAEEEITGRASSTDDDLAELFESADKEHFDDGFYGDGEDIDEH